MRTNAPRSRCNKKNSKHHIIPRSRLRGNPISHVCTVKDKIHKLSHELFGNMIPSEILRWLNRNLWDNMYEITIRRKDEKVATP